MINLNSLTAIFEIWVAIPQIQNRQNGFSMINSYKQFKLHYSNLYFDFCFALMIGISQTCLRLQLFS